MIIRLRWAAYIMPVGHMGGGKHGKTDLDDLRRRYVIVAVPLASV